MWILRCRMSTSRRSKPRTSPRRRWHQAASSTAIRHGSGIAAARASTSAMDSIGRSGDLSCEAPFTTQGFRTISSSATALVSIAFKIRDSPGREHCLLDPRSPGQSRDGAAEAPICLRSPLTSGTPARHHVDDISALALDGPGLRLMDTMEWPGPPGPAQERLSLPFVVRSSVTVDTTSNGLIGVGHCQ